MRLLPTCFFLAVLAASGCRYDSAAPSTVNDDAAQAGVPLAPAFVDIPTGVFTMGANLGEAPQFAFLERPQFAVRISQPFALQTTQVTQYQWFLVFGANPSSNADVATCPEDFAMIDGVALCVNHPVETITWDEAQAFVDALNAPRRSDDPVRAAYPAGFTYQLPSEAQWERAARGGTQTTYWFGDDASELDVVDWTKANSGGHSHVVASAGRANPFGLFDVLGNVWQWLSGFHQENYPLGTAGADGVVTDPVVLTGAVHPLRGCSYATGGLSCRAAYRNFGDVSGAGPDGKRPTIGLRVMRNG